MRLRCDARGLLGSAGSLGGLGFRLGLRCRCRRLGALLRGLGLGLGFRRCGGCLLFGDALLVGLERLGAEAAALCHGIGALWLLVGALRALLEHVGSCAAAHALGHSHAHEAGHCASSVVGGILHGIGRGIRHDGCRLVGVDHRLGHLAVGDLGLDILGQRDGVDAERDDRDAATLRPLGRKLVVQDGGELLGVRGDGAVADAHLGDAGERRLQGRQKLAFHLRLQAVARVGLLDVAADVLVEQQRVGDLVGVLAVHAHLGIEVKPQVGIDHAEGDRRGGTVLVAVDFLRVEEVDALVFARIAAEGEALADALEGGLDALAQIAVED